MFEVTMRLDKTNTNSHLDLGSMAASTALKSVRVTENINETENEDKSYVSDEKQSEAKSKYLEKDYVELSPTERNNAGLN